MFPLTPETAPFLHPPPLDGGRARLSSRQWMRAPGRRWAAHCPAPLDELAARRRPRPGGRQDTMNDAAPCLYGRSGAVPVELWS